MDAQNTHVAAAIFERHWPLSAVTVGPVLQGYGGGIVGVIEADQGRFVYKRTPAEVPHVNEQSTFILDFLAERSYAHAPKVLHANRGTRTSAVDGATITVMEYVAGTPPEPTPENYAQLAEILAALNSIKDYPFECPITLEAIRPGFERMAQRLERAVDRKHFVEFAERLVDIDTLPRSLIHFDMNLHNTIRRPDGMLVAVDWDEAGMGARVLDPGHFLISSFVSEDLEFDAEAARAFYGTYLSRVSLRDGEIRAIFDASVFHALRSVVWSNAERRWQRIVWAAEHKDELTSAVCG